MALSVNIFSFFSMRCFRIYAFTHEMKSAPPPFALDFLVVNKKNEKNTTRYLTMIFNVIKYALTDNDVPSKTFEGFTMTDIIIVAVIVAVAAFFVVRRFVRSASSSGSSCGCSGCGSSCTPQQKSQCNGD